MIPFDAGDIWSWTNNAAASITTTVIFRRRVAKVDAPFFKRTFSLTTSVS